MVITARQLRDIGNEIYANQPDVQLAIVNLLLDEPEFFGSFGGGPRSDEPALTELVDMALLTEAGEELLPLDIDSQIEVLVKYCRECSHGEFLGSLLAAMPKLRDELSPKHWVPLQAAFAAGIKYAAINGVDH